MDKTTSHYNGLFNVMECLLHDYFSGETFYPTFRDNVMLTTHNKFITISHSYAKSK
jgi:hypothetical protein